MKICLAVLLSISGLVVLALPQEPVQPPRTPRIITATKQVSLFTELEKQMLQAVQKKDRPALEAKLGDDCMMLFPKADPLYCDDWVDSVMAKDFTLKTYMIHGMSVTDLGDAALVNYERVQQAELGQKNLSGEFFVLDLWRKSGDSWKLANRYVSRIESLPATPPVKPTPTGKE